MDKWRLYCIDDSAWKEVIADSAPTECPDNASHEFTQEHITEDGVLVNSGGLPTELSLGNYKALAIHAIDARTTELIESGFTYASKQFSLSLTAQAKMMGTHQVRNDPALTYPIDWNTIDDADVYSIADATDLEGFYLTALGTIRAHLDSGTSLKDSVRAAADEAGVDAVVDNR